MSKIDLECVKKSFFLVKSLLIYDSILKCSHGTFVIFIHENGVPRGNSKYSWKMHTLCSEHMKLAGEATSL
jgi:hypothetical protein